ncbi:MAG TPA: cobalamin-independent methionine synthase II family protein, partial [Dehalococcoidia bacterium]|nr:cobalamin-independent methionine synthase II family protein [Dehalococcoidia bacterium]
SKDRILTTHGGSLTRPDDLLAMIEAKDAGRPYDEAAFAKRVTAEVAEVVRRQRDAGIDVVSDGEEGKPGFFTYIDERLTGFETRPDNAPPGPRFADMRDHPEYADIAPQGLSRPVCVGPITYVGQAQLQTDIDNFKAALQGVNVEEGFLPAAAPGMVSADRPNEYYKSREEMLYATADALREEYRGIVDAGFVLQLDAPDIPMAYPRKMHEWTKAEYLKDVELLVEVTNHSLQGIAPEMVRFHVCWGNYEAPHHYDVEVREIAPSLVKLRCGALYVEAANPRHEHEWSVWRDVKLPDGMALIAGIIDTKTNIVEHPELVAERIVRFADVVGRENVIAGTDCGFGTVANRRRVFPSVMWAKLRVLSDGAAIASKRLW